MCLYSEKLPRLQPNHRGQLPTCRFLRPDANHQSKVSEQLLKVVRPGQKATELDNLTLVHHFLGFQTYYMTLPFAPWGLIVTFAGNMLWVEFSTFFISFRWLLFFYGYMGDDWRQTVNSILGAIAFLFGRTLVLLYVVTFLCAPWFFYSFLQSAYTVGEFLFVLECMIVLAFNVCLNIYWSSLILKQVSRIFSRGKKADHQHVELAELKNTSRNP